MVEFALALVTLAGKILLFLIMFKLFWTSITKGKDILASIVDTVFMAMRTIIKKIQKWLFKEYKGKPKEETKEAPPVQQEAPQPQPQPQPQAYQPQPTVEPPPYNWSPQQWQQVPPPYDWKP